MKRLAAIGGNQLADFLPAPALQRQHRQPLKICLSHSISSRQLRYPGRSRNGSASFSRRSAQIPKENGNMRPPPCVKQRGGYPCPCRICLATFATPCANSGSHRFLPPLPCSHWPSASAAPRPSSL